MAEIASVWDTYNKTKDPAQREQLILEYIPVVKFVAGRLCMHLKGHVELEDMISYGIFGLIDAIDKFSFEKGVKFETYASVRIRGAILDGIRKLDWIPRTIRQESKRMEQVYAELESVLGREPKDEEIAEKLNISLEETREMIRKSSIAICISLDDYLEQNHEGAFPAGPSHQAPSQPEDAVLRREAKDVLAAAIEKLSEKERLVVTLYYYEELTLKEISKVMGVSESRVSQIHSKAVLKLKMRIGKYMGLVNV